MADSLIFATSTFQQLGMSISRQLTNAIAPLGDAAVRIDCGAAGDLATATRVAQVAATLSQERCLGVTDVVPAYGVVTVHYEPAVLFSIGVASPYQFVVDWIELRVSTNATTTGTDRREVVLPIVYGGEFGPDIETVAERNRLPLEEVIRRHSDSRYKVRAIGFTPGFPYLEGLPAELTTPRRATPRTLVPAGSVGIGGSQTGVYPCASPGGWNLIGRTPLWMFNETSTPAALLRVGDTVRFQPIDRAAFDELAREDNRKSKRLFDTASFEPVFEVIRPGLQTTIQDLGRPGHQSEGVSPGGAMDSLAARVANLLVGNAEDAPLLESAQVGPKLRVIRDATVAITGAAVGGVASGRPIRFAKGQTLDCSAIEGAGRIYLAVSGGFAAECVLDGWGTDLSARFGGYHGRALAAGDRLCLALATQDVVANRESAHWFASPKCLPPPEPHGRLRVMRGPQADWFSDEAWSRLLDEAFTVSPQSNRMGIRLTGPKLERNESREMTSEPVVHGAIQVPPDGQPIILAADRQTIGGYPTIACVISADRSRLGQLRPGNEERFVEVSHAEAEAILADCERNLETLRMSVRGLVSR